MVHLKNYKKVDLKYFLNEKNLYIEYSHEEVKKILDVTLQYKVDVYESKIEFLIDYVSIWLKKEKESLDWRHIGVYNKECSEFIKENYDIKQYIWSNLAEREKSSKEVQREIEERERWDEELKK